MKLARAGFVFIGAALTGTAAAAPWEFRPALDVTATHGAGVFHHLDAAGRKSIAAGNNAVAVVWEDNRDGAPRCYFARKALSAAVFALEIRLSGDGDCYEPAVAALADGRFAAVYEEGGRVHARLIGESGAGAVIALSENTSAQATIGSDGEVLYAAWSEKDGRFSRVRVARITVDKEQLRVAHRASPDSEPLKDDQLYPSVAPARDGALAVAWEDRRHGHTVIMHSHTADGKRFAPPQRINELPPPEVGNARNLNLGRGSGAMRVALARQDEKRLIAVWLDKRDFLSGYDVYAALSNDGGRSFGKNQKVQDEFGNEIAQWHPAVSATADHMAVAWDDDRDETADIWLSWQEAGGWSADAVPGEAGGEGEHSDPSIALHPNGDLSLVWIEKQSVSGPTRLRYLHGQRRSGP